MNKLYENKKTIALVIGIVIVFIGLLVAMNDIARLDKELNGFQSVNEKLLQDIEGLRLDVSRLNSEIMLLEDRNDELILEIESERAKSVALKGQLNDLESQKIQLEKQKIQLEVKNKELSTPTRSMSRKTPSKSPSTTKASSNTKTDTNTQVATPTSSKRLLGTFESTAYDLSFASCGKNPGDKGYGITASGMKAGPGVVAVDPKVIPLGTKLYIEGYGNAVAGDTGGAIKGRIIDVFIADSNAVRQWGRRQVKVWIRE